MANIHDGPEEHLVYLHLLVQWRWTYAKGSPGAPGAIRFGLNIRSDYLAWLPFNVTIRKCNISTNIMTNRITRR